IYAGARRDGDLKSTAGGAAWSARTTGLPNVPIVSLAIDPQSPFTLYAGSKFHGVFKSTDGSGSWSEVNAGLTDTDIYAGDSDIRVNAIAIDPQTPTTLYAGKYAGVDRSVFKSTDGGGSWSRSGLTSIYYVLSLAIDPQTPTTLHAGTLVDRDSEGRGVCTSIDGGITWSAINIGLTNLFVNALTIDSQTPSILYAGTAGGGVFKSADAGGTWSVINTGLTDLSVSALAIDPLTLTTLYAGTGAGVFALRQAAGQC